MELIRVSIASIILASIAVFGIVTTTIHLISFINKKDKKDEPDGIIIKYSDRYALVAFERENSEECNFSWAFEQTKDVLSSYNKENVFYLNLSDNSICKMICNRVFQSISNSSTILNGFIMNEDITTYKTYLIRVLLPDNKSAVFNFKIKFIDQ